ncbi:MAG: CoA-binding protein [Paracoccaceae bacterium]
MNEIANDEELRRILRETRVIAAVGVSMNPIRPSYFVARYLSLRGFRVIPVNPGHAGKRLFGEEIHADLASIPDSIRVDMVDIFRRSEHVPPIVQAAIAHLGHLRTVWMQIGVMNQEAAAMARAQNLNVIQNHCPKIEYQRLFGELRMGGFNTGIVSSKL